VRSNAEHWFSNSRVSTVYVVLEKGSSNEYTKFITLNFKLEEKLDQEDVFNQLKQIETIYAEIDNCNNNRNPGWRQDATFNDLFHKTDGTIDVCIVPKEKLIESIETHENWSKYFVSATLFEAFDEHLTQLFPGIIDVFRGESTGWNDFYIVKGDEIAETNISSRFVYPLVKSPTELEFLEFPEDFNYEYFLFVCSESKETMRGNGDETVTWIDKFENRPTKNGKVTVKENGLARNHRPYWYTLRPAKANIVFPINPYERYFFSYSLEGFYIDQRLTGINIHAPYDPALIAALFNSVITFLTIEMRGTSRNLGALDLNANYFKKLRVLNPDSLNQQSATEILSAFQPLKNRPIKTIFEEVTMEDRINFDSVILRCYGIEENILESLYQTLVSAVSDRVTMKER